MVKITNNQSCPIGYTGNKNTQEGNGMITFENLKEEVLKTWESKKYKDKEMQNILARYKNIRRRIENGQSEDSEEMIERIEHLWMKIRDYNTRKSVGNFKIK